MNLNIIPTFFVLFNNSPSESLKFVFEISKFKSFIKSKDYLVLKCLIKSRDEVRIRKSEMSNHISLSIHTILDKFNMNLSFHIFRCISVTDVFLSKDAQLYNNLH